MMNPLPQILFLRWVESKSNRLILSVFPLRKNTFVVELGFSEIQPKDWLLCWRGQLSALSPPFCRPLPLHGTGTSSPQPCLSRSGSTEDRLWFPWNLTWASVGGMEKVSRGTFTFSDFVWQIEWPYLRYQNSWMKMTWAMLRAVPSTWRPSPAFVLR